MTRELLSAADLAALPLFEGARLEELDGLASASERVTLDEGDILFRQGDAASTLYWVESGRIGLRVDHDGRSTLVMTVGSADLVGWAALEASGASSLTTARAMSRVRLIAMPADPFIDHLASGSPGARLLLQRLFGYAAAHLAGTRSQLLRPGSQGVITAG